jgi:hypothetical protein
MKYGKAFIGLVAVLMADYDNVSKGSSVRIKSLSPFVGLYNVEVLDGDRKGTTALIHSTRLEENPNQPAAAPVKEETKTPLRNLKIVKVKDLALDKWRMVIERNRKVNLRGESFSTELSAFVDKVNSDTIFSVSMLSIVCELSGPNAGLGLSRDGLSVPSSRLDRISKHQVTINDADDKAVGYFFVAPRNNGDIERWARTQSNAFSLEIDLTGSNLSGKAEEAEAENAVGNLTNEVDKLTAICRNHYRVLTDKVELLTSDAEVEKALQGLWYLETGEVVPNVVLETLGIK